MQSTSLHAMTTALFLILAAEQIESHLILWLIRRPEIELTG